MSTYTRAKLLLLIAILSCSTAVHATRTTAEQLLKNCESEVDVINGICLAYIAGFYDGFRHTIHTEYITTDSGFYLLVDQGYLVCLPREISYSQMQRVYIKWAREHPEKLHLYDSEALMQAFADAWPCDGELRGSSRWLSE